MIMLLYYYYYYVWLCINDIRYFLKIHSDNNFVILVISFTCIFS
jgi:hypothetical protein